MDKRVTNLGGEELGKDVWQDTTLGDDDGTEELVELFIVSDGELQVSGYDTGLLVVSGGVTCEFEDLGSEVWGMLAWIKCGEVMIR